MQTVRDEKKKLEKGASEGCAHSRPSSLHRRSRSNSAHRCKQERGVSVQSGHVPESVGESRTFITICDESNWPSLSPCEADLTSPSILRVSPQLKSSMFQYE